MKLYRNIIIILVVVFLGLLGLFISLKLNPEDETAEKNDDKSIVLFDFDAEQVTEFYVEGAEDKFAFKKKDTEWEMTSGGEFPLNILNVNAIISNTSDLKAYKLIEENATSLDTYGLDDPYRVVVKMSDGAEKVLEIGDKTPTKQAYYVKKGDSNSVYTVYTYIANLIVTTKDKLRNKTVFDVFSTDVVKFVLDRDGKRVFWAEKSEEEGWQLKEPIEGNTDLVRLTSIFDTFVRADAETYIEEDAQDLSQYGLDNPQYVIEAATADVHVKLYLGKGIEGGSKFYAKVDGSNEVFTIDKSSLAFIDINTIEVCEALVYTPFIYDVSKVEVNIDDKTIVLDIESDSSNTEEDKFFIDGLDVMSKGDKGEDAFRSYYRSLVGVVFHDIELLDEKPTGTPEITITYTLEIAPGEMVVEFVPKDDKNYYVLENGEYLGKIVKKSVFDEPDGVRKNYDKLMEVLKQE